MKISGFLSNPITLDIELIILENILNFTDQEKKLAQFFVEREGAGILEEIKNMDFMEAGIIDSLDLVSLAVFIERNFNKKINLADPATFKAMRRFDSLLALIAP
jgi:acyl carrier protein